MKKFKLPDWELFKTTNKRDKSNPLDKFYIWIVEQYYPSAKTLYNPPWFIPDGKEIDVCKVHITEEDTDKLRELLVKHVKKHYSFLKIEKLRSEASFAMLMYGPSFTRNNEESGYVYVEPGFVRKKEKER